MHSIENEASQGTVKLDPNLLVVGADASHWYDATQTTGIKLINVTDGTSGGWPGVYGGVYWIEFGSGRGVQIWFGGLS